MKQTYTHSNWHLLSLKLRLWLITIPNSWLLLKHMVLGYSCNNRHSRIIFSSTEWISTQRSERVIPQQVLLATKVSPIGVIMHMRCTFIKNVVHVHQLMIVYSEQLVYIHSNCCTFTVTAVHSQQLFTFTVTAVHSHQLLYIHSNCSTFTTAVHSQQLLYIHSNCCTLTTTIVNVGTHTLCLYLIHMTLSIFFQKASI